MSPRPNTKKVNPTALKITPPKTPDPIQKKDNVDSDSHTLKNYDESRFLNFFSKLLFWSENEKSSQFLQQLNGKLPNFVGSFLASLAMFILGISARGIGRKYYKINFRCTLQNMTELKFYY